MSCCGNCDECEETSTNNCLEDCGCDTEITSLACIRHNGSDMPCIEVVKGETLEAIIQKIEDKICSFTTGIDGDDGDDGQGVDHVSFTGEDGTEGQPGQTSTYTIWGDVAETINLGTFVVYNGVDGQGIDHTSFTSTSGPVVTAGAPGQTDTYTLWGDSLETINLGTFVVYNGDNGMDGYDSGWITMNNFNTTHGFGLPSFISLSWTHPKIRVIGKTLFMEGFMMIPLSGDKQSGTTLISDVPEYPNQYRSETRVFSGTSGGFDALSDGMMKTKSPILPTVLAPSQTHILNSFEMIYRPVNDLGNTLELNLTSILPSTIINTDGTLEITTLSYTDQNATAGGTIVLSSQFHQMVSRTSRGLAAPNHNIFYTEYDGSSIDKRLSPVSSALYPSTFNGKVAKDLGGFRIKATTSYPIGQNVTLLQIQQAIAQIQS